jgi:predicted TIM-barrel fold metal-dependent hydrolase
MGWAGQTGWTAPPPGASLRRNREDAQRMSEPILGVAHSPTGLALPAGACDCHTHVFGPAGRYPFAEGRSYTPGDASVEALLALQAALGLQRVVIVHPSPYGSDNACTLDAVARLGDRARGVAVIDAATPPEALQAMQAGGIRGIRANLESAGQHDPAAARAMLETLAARIAPLGWHLQIYTNLPVIAALAEVLAALPVTVVIDHYGLARSTGAAGFGALRQLVASGRAYVKLSAPHRISDDPDRASAAPVARALAAANPERILWGSDWPHPGAWPGAPRRPEEIEPFHPIDDGQALRWIAATLDDPALLRLLLVDNPARLYGF